MNESVNSAAVATPVARFGSDEYILALGELPTATDEQIEAACAAADRLERRQKNLAVAQATEAETQAEAIAVEEKAVVAAEAADYEAFVRERMWAANELTKKRDPELFDVIQALRGEHAAGWAKSKLEHFLKGKYNRFHNIVEETLALVREVIAKEEAKAAEAERIRQEAKKRQARIRADRAIHQSRSNKKTHK